MHVDQIGMRAISMGKILAHNIGCAIRHPTTTTTNRPKTEAGRLPPPLLYDIKVY